jgi:hypothetical protein
MSEDGLGEEAFDGEARGFLLGFLLGGAFRFAEGSEPAVFVADADFDAETLLMVGAALSDEGVVGLTEAGGLEVLLEGGFVVADGSAEGGAGFESEVEAGQRGLDDVLVDEGAGGVEAAIEIERGDDGFEGVGEERGFTAASALLFSAAEKKKRAELDAGGDLAEMAAADQGGAETGELAFAGVGETEEKGFGDGQTENGVAYELKLLVVGGWVLEGFGFGLVGEGTVSESPGEELGTVEAVIEEFLNAGLDARLRTNFGAR